MEHLDHPPRQVWEARRAWFESAEETARGQGGYLVSEQACALAADLQAVFCAGAWAAVIILAMAVVDAAVRETELPAFRGSTKDLLDLVGATSDVQALRVRRNELLHVNPHTPALTVDEHWRDRARLEQEARRAVLLMWEAFYSNPSV
jgi:hypothetical protein